MNTWFSIRNEMCFFFGVSTFPFLRFGFYFYHHFVRSIMTLWLDFNFLLGQASSQRGCSYLVMIWLIRHLFLLFSVSSSFPSPSSSPPLPPSLSPSSESRGENKKRKTKKHKKWPYESEAQVWVWGWVWVWVLNQKEEEDEDVEELRTWIWDLNQ